MLIAVSGKGGVGKTVLSALLLDEAARRGFPGPALAVDGDPAATLSLALGLPEPAATVADVRDTTPLDAGTIHSLPVGTTPAHYVQERLLKAGAVAAHRLRQMRLHLVSMGRGEGPGCYCSVNQALAAVLGSLVAEYPLVVVDNEAGLEHLSRYRLPRADLFLVVVTPNRASQAVAARIMETVQQVDIGVGQCWTLFNQAPPGFQAPDERTLVMPRAETVLDFATPVVEVVAETDPLRSALRPVVEAVLA